MLASYPRPSFFPTYVHDYNSILAFEFSWATVQAAIYLVYYFLLLPSAAVGAHYYDTRFQWLTET